MPPATAPATAAASPLPDTGSPAGTPALTRADAEAWLDGYLPYALESGDIAGAVVVVVKDGQVLLQKGYGYSDLDKRTPVDPAGTLFRPGSVSKLFTWTAVMQLVEQGKLDLDADVNRYIDFKIPPRDGKPMTLRQIMTHTTGLEEQIRGLISSDADQIVSLEAALKRWVPERIHVPGATPAYSNYATALAGYIVQRVSGEPFDAYIARHIFQPLGMAHSSFAQPLPPALLAKMSKGYDKASDGKPKDYEFISLAPAGSLAATGTDMGRFMIAHLQDGAYGDARILGADTARKMHSTAQASVGPLSRMMLGFYESTVNGHRAIAHGGDTMWFHSDLQLFLDDGIGIFVSMNSSGRDGATGHIRGALVRGFADRYLPGPATRAAAGVAPEQAKLHAQQMVGHYDSSRRPQSNLLSLANLLGQVKVIANEDGTISVPMATDASGAPKKWREIAPYLWQDVAGSDRLAADVVDGKVVRFTMEPYAPIMVFERLSLWRSLTLPLLAASLAVLLLTVLAWPISALVRRHYGVAYGLSAADARAQRVARLTALAVLVSIGGALGFVVAMLSDLEMTGSGSDAMINALRLFALVALPVGAALSLWSAWQALRGRRRWLAKLWAVLLALACLFLLWVGLANHLIGYGAYY
ncbi:serine hydrolase domain-containing protein [Xanthomonas sp. NCPPB 2654]|uniref:serine hydrolase domain-containing protein n=1 Tax=unclassified Xanthomonas TaxID=2643310 RepID=UPI0021DFFDE9|nr:MULTISPECIES: serine hydrolase domain-containing protein [unclassified Xanthomonas]MDL5366629.1 serine hydrolase domain-containing protein [Xanthomonas sp. NCPPB 2654]UYC21191.1 beta-lactamase family protein [Xanthomonas sp. CFBP 8443]